MGGATEPTSWWEGKHRDIFHLLCEPRLLLLLLMHAASGLMELAASLDRSLLH